nr:Transcriptional regulator, GntR family domain / Aspartate aminotransferase [Kibdelosporangium sp. MJ126-NF4]CTQ90594.1 Transcriptional regulator, GntR family domain / Aspartate aminotransferase (EC 2.6.1.1) [Kibdelosporangium sp. MJ126-NF4]
MPDELPILQFVDRPGITDLGWGHPRPELLPVRQWHEATRAALDTYDWRAMTYGHSAGPGPLVEWLATRMGEVDGAPGDPAEFFVTAGASHALELIAKVLAEPGDVVLVDAPTYHFALQIFRDHGMELVSAPQDAIGIDVEALDELVRVLRGRGKRVAFLYLVPTFGNPTGQSLSASRRDGLTRFASIANVTVVEDDTYRELGYDGAPPQSLWTSAPGGPIVRVGSFSKTVAPGLRLGFVQAGPHVVAKLAGLGYVTSGGGLNHLVALTMAAFARSGAYQAHVERIRAAYRAQRDALVGALRAELPDFAVPAPPGGWFLWLRLPAGMTAKTLLAAAEPLGVSFAEGTDFHIDPNTGDDHIRLSYSLLPPAELADAAALLARAVRSLA